jgi:predicted outer membrane repeat protein
MTEWNETRFGPNQWCLRGGAWDVNPIAMAAFLRDRNNPAYLESWNFGFRVASIQKTPAIYYVDSDAAGANDGSSWDDAFNYLQDALSAASSGDEIRVAQGIYRPSEFTLPLPGQASNPNPVDGATDVNPPITLSWTAGAGADSYKIYFGTSSPPSFISQQSDTFFYPGTLEDYTTYYWRIDSINVWGKTTGPTWSFTTGEMLPPPPPPPPPPRFGESMEQATATPVSREDTFQLKNGVVIKGGYAGFGGPDPNARDIEAHETILSGDLAANDEPNFVNYDENSYHVVTGSDCNESAVLDGFTITAGYANGSNPDNSGGGMYNTYGSPTVINCTFTKNAAGNAGAMANRYYCSPTLINCTFIGNAVTSSGAGIFNWRHSNSTLINCNFTGNFGRYGAAMRIHNSSPTLTNCSFSGNFARQQGGAIYVSYSSVELSNCSFSSNVTTLYYGGGIYDHEGSSSLFLTNCILFNNIDSGGMDESAQIHGGTPVVNYCCIQGWTGTWPGLGNTGSDPVFVRNPDDGGDGWGVGNRDNFGALLSIGKNDDFGDLHLLPNSPCINTGDPDYIAEPNEIDLNGKPRIIGGRIDMGAYEFNHVPVADVGPDQTVEVQAPWGAVVTLDGSGSSDADSTPGTNDDIIDFNWYQLDPCDPNADVFLGCGVIVDCNLPIGEHIILLEVTDRAGASDTNEVIIIVQDTTPPDINCPQDVTLECPADTSPSATGKATATDTCGDVTITHGDQWQPGCGNTETIERTWIATDEYGNSSNCVQIITIVDTTPPQFVISVEPTMLWPPDHKMYEITPSWTVSDECDAAPDVSLVSILANEGDNTIGDGHTSNDIQINGDGSIYLRSERSGTDGDRIYTITYQAVDDCGNTTVRSATVSIPHDFRMLARIAARWLWSGPGRIPEDLNGDGFVNLADIARFAGNWTR